MNKEIEWHTKRQADSTHAIDDGGMVYYCTVGDITTEDLETAFRAGYDGECGALEITELRIELKLINYRTNEIIRAATDAEAEASIEQAEHDGGAGVIDVDGVPCYVA